MPLKVHSDDLPTINLTSMIDVVFLLIIFFMVGTRFTETEANVSIDLPRVSDTATPGQQFVTKTVNVLKDGSIELDRQVMNLNDLARTLSVLRQSNPQASVTVRSDASVTVQRFSEVAAAIKQSGIQRLTFTTAQSTMSQPTVHR